MTGRIGALAAVACLSLVLILGLQHAGAQWGPGEGRRPGGGGPTGGGSPMDGPGRPGPMMSPEARDRMEAMRALEIDSRWAVLTFEVRPSASQFDSLRSAFQSAWDARATTLRSAEASDKVDWKGIRDQLKRRNDDLEKTIKGVLTDDQRKAYSEALKQREKSAPGMPMDRL